MDDVKIGSVGWVHRSNVRLEVPLDQRLTLSNWQSILPDLMPQALAQLAMGDSVLITLGIDQSDRQAGKSERIGVDVTVEVVFKGTQEE